MLFQEIGNRLLLVVWHGEYITKASTAVNDLLASAFGLEHRRAWVDLCCSDSSDERTRCWERRIEFGTALLDSFAYKEYCRNG